MYLTTALVLTLILWMLLHRLLLARSIAKVKIKGFVAPGFEPVRNAFEENFRRGLEASAQCCVYFGEEKVSQSMWPT